MEGCLHRKRRNTVGNDLDSRKVKQERNAILASTQRTIEYKNISFDTISWQEIENRLINRKVTGNIWKTKEDEKWKEQRKMWLLHLKQLRQSFRCRIYRK